MLTTFIKSLEQMETSFKLGAKNVKECSVNVETALNELKNKKFTEDLSKSDQIDSTAKLIEKLSILNEYKLNLFKDFSDYNLKKK